ncbi:LysR family transcriptional regulator [Magnetococcus sp. PR-3]|uniref:LysR family transcriptional regulator n=1 Tax=Magnetococcus sp. PR-3 TaxID=3120355 RepID=UPI002FCE04D5
MINPTFLRTFMCVVETGHFTQTAKRLHMTQPGVSQHIQKLERQLEQPLLNRHGKSFELTVAGEQLYAYGLQQAQAEVALHRALTADCPNTGVCKLACSGAMAMQLYPKLLTWQQQHPALSMQLEAAPNPAIVARVLSNQSDLGLVTQPVQDAALAQQILGQDALCLILPAGVEASWSTLMALGFIDHPDGDHYASQLLEANFPQSYRGMGAIPKTSYINQLSQILLPIAMGLGFTVLPHSALAAFPEPKRLHIAPLVHPVNETVYLITKKHRPLPARYGGIRSLLESQWGAQPLRV